MIQRFYLVLLKIVSGTVLLVATFIALVGTLFVVLASVIVTVEALFTLVYDLIIDEVERIEAGHKGVEPPFAFPLLSRARMHWRHSAENRFGPKVSGSL